MEVNWSVVAVNALVQFFLWLAGYLFYLAARWLWRRAGGISTTTGGGSATTGGGGSGSSGRATVGTDSLKGIESEVLVVYIH